MNIWLNDPLMLLGSNVMWSISISTNPYRGVLIQSIIESSKLVLNLKPNWLLSQSQGYSKKMGKYAPVSRLLALLKQLVNQSFVEINGSETDASWQTSENSKLKELFVSKKLLCRRISKDKSQSVYIVAHLKTNLKVHKILLSWMILCPTGVPWFWSSNRSNQQNL